MTGRVPYLDGLRALAILLVVTFHTIEYQPWLAAHHQWFWAFVLSQGHGVQLFFVLSGFCLAYPTLAKLQKTGGLNFDVARFTARRIVRILPSYWIAIAVLLPAMFLLVHFGIEPGGGMPSHLGALKLLEQVFLFNLRPEWLNGSFWTLPIEVHWYFVCPILLWVWTRSPRAFACIALLCWFAAATTRFQAPDVKFLPAFMLGIAAADIRVRGAWFSKYMPLAFVALAIFGTYNELHGTALAYPSWELAMFALVVAVGELPALGRVFSLRIFAPIAAASYSIYLVHAPVLGTLEKYLPASIPVGEALLIGGAVGIAAGLLFSLIAERPFRRGALRQAMLDRLDTALPGWFRFAGVEPSVALVARPATAAEPAKVPEITPSVVGDVAPATA